MTSYIDAVLAPFANDSGVLVGPVVTRVGRRMSDPPTIERKRPLLSVWLMGPMVVTVDGIGVDTTSSRQVREVLAYLIVNRHGAVARDVLIDILWPDASPDVARNRLNVAFSNVRSALKSATDHPVIEHHQGLYRLRPDIDVWVDIEAFDHRIDWARARRAEGDSDNSIRALRDAVALSRYELLSDDPYVDWVVERREPLRLRAVEARVRLAELLFERGAYDECLELSWDVLARNRFDERSHRMLMRTFVELGHRQQALYQFERCEQVFRRELAARPSPETVSLARSLGLLDCVPVS